MCNKQLNSFFQWWLHQDKCTQKFNWLRNWLFVGKESTCDIVAQLPESDFVFIHPITCFVIFSTISSALKGSDFSKLLSVATYSTNTISNRNFRKKFRNSISSESLSFSSFALQVSFLDGCINPVCQQHFPAISASHTAYKSVIVLSNDRK